MSLNDAIPAYTIIKMGFFIQSKFKTCTEILKHLLRYYSQLFDCEKKGFSHRYSDLHLRFYNENLFLIGLKYKHRFDIIIRCLNNTEYTII